MGTGAEIEPGSTSRESTAPNGKPLDVPKLFSALYLSKLLGTSAKLIFS